MTRCVRERIAEFVNEDVPGIEPVRLLNDDAATTTGFRTRAVGDAIRFLCFMNESRVSLSVCLRPS